MQRRQFLAQCTAASLAAAIANALPAGSPPRSPRILLRSSWQCVNIGDIAHTPGVLALLEKHLPDATVTLWASGNLTDEVAAMEHVRFPQLKIVKGSIGSQGTASNAELQAAIAETDFLLHGSGPSLVAAKDVAAFVKHVGKPFGVYGITHGSFLSGNGPDLLSQADFVFFRDSVSLQLARDEGVTCPVMEFGPDGAFACDLRNDQAAEKFLASNGLETGKFLCCLSRLRYTPYWTIPGDHRKSDPKRVARNEEMAEHDHAPIREAIERVVRETDLKVLLCPEDMTQMAVGKKYLYDKLPTDVKPRVVWRENYWLTDEALSVYVRSAGLFGSEMHSPIMAVGNGIPAIVCRFAEQTSKGIMWRDIGLGDWLFDLDVDSEAAAVPAAVLAMARDFTAAKAKTEIARQFVLKRQHETMGVLRDELSENT
ncbi:polysaccharide pyruvyl transferase family protein [Allorhodopirellula heiligendammensis]|uniref:Polysaccharide pyruvyl transferase n=1 Tax=Allorhodopirellula heiligendammensis TaxID=2714739 RepID=A0A5C6BWZ9_9BACT|nr:polysaccharide pyruvyl transferase family protein [Allorhodopirellula heiligendammensis]TWU15324.1 Polysaccharide pyruvyl transferase [Allorhodopirellula heiligendammensis]